MKYSKRISSMQYSPIRKLVPIANKAKANGIKVYHLNIGQPDIKTPKGFFDEVRAMGIKDGDFMRLNDFEFEYIL